MRNKYRQNDSPRSKLKTVKKKKKVKKWGERKVLALQKNRVFVAKIISCISEAM